MTQAQVDALKARNARFRRLRRRLGLTQAQLAQRLDCSTSYIQKMETGKKNVRAVYLLALERLEHLDHSTE
ncbi:MAG: helix-turn-helix domain-containing protein [Bacteroidetes bacterium]|jgi:transcriptional regulator with XRE-family HTH domain|nr:helix-turn-helix domain-containing protein [Bacteroidota bacterium]